MMMMVMMVMMMMMMMMTTSHLLECQNVVGMDGGRDKTKLVSLATLPLHTLVSRLAYREGFNGEHQSGRMLPLPSPALFHD